MYIMVGLETRSITDYLRYTECPHHPHSSGPAFAAPHVLRGRRCPHPLPYLMAGKMKDLKKRHVATIVRG